MNNDRSTHYRIFVLTIWYEEEMDSADPATWRIRLEEPKRNVRVGCVGIEGLMALLRRQIMVKPNE